MNAVELALLRQHLQHEAGIQREQLAAHVSGLQPMFDVADNVHSGLRWLRQHPELAAGTAVLVAASPRARHFLWRWTKRSVLAWKLWRESERWLLASRPLR